MLARMSGKAEQAHEAKNALHLGDAIRGEVALLIGLGTATIFLAGGSQFVELVAHPVVMIVVFIWLFAVILWSAVSAARHADCLAIKWGEPYGTLILTLSAITIEVVVVSTAMLHGENNPTLGRDSVFSVIMIALNGFVGLCLLMGGLRYREQTLQPARRQLLYQRYHDRVRHKTIGGAWCARWESTTSALNARCERGYVYQQKDECPAGLCSFAAICCICAAAFRAVSFSASYASRCITTASGFFSTTLNPNRS